MSKPNNMQKTALTITRWIGSPLSIIIHTVIFVSAITILVKGIFPFDVVILILNTVVSLEAIYLALFIQMTVNYQSESIEEVAEDIEEIQSDVGEIQSDVDELQEDVEDISEDVEEMTEDISEEEQAEAQHKKTIIEIQSDLRKLMQDIEKLQQR